jgi:hypothetical protein
MNTISQPEEVRLMKRALFVVLAVVILFAVVAPLGTTALADGPWGHGQAKVIPGSGYNKVCMYSYWNCSYRFVPPYPVSGYYKYPYNTYFTPDHHGKSKHSGHYNPNWCTPGLLCGQQMSYGGGYGGGY